VLERAQPQTKGLALVSTSGSADVLRASPHEEVRVSNDNRGFGSMDEQKQREIASEGGKAAHEKGTAHEWTPEEAREAGRKGGEAVSSDREHMAEIGRQGGEARGGQGGGQSTRGGGSEQHRQAGEQSHKNG
jgi:general stress protein YciG